MNTPQLLLENQLCHRLYMANNMLTRTYRPMLDALGLTYPQYLVMMALWQEDQIPVNKLQKQTQIDSGALTLILKKMQEKALLSITPVKDDKRKKCVALTTQGLQLKDTATGIPDQIICQFPNVEAKEFEQLKQLLDKLLATASS